METILITVAVVIFEELFKQGIILMKDMIRLIANLLYLSSRKYRENFIKRHSCVVMLEENDHLRTSLNLEQLFIETRFLVNNAYQSGIEVANETQYLIVHGQPGAGKSVFLKWLAMEALKREERIYNHQLIPVFIDSERLNSPDINLLNLIQNEFLLADLPYVDKFTQEALQRGRLLILIDGIDRISEENYNRSRAITHIQDFIHLYDKNRFVISCRTQNRYIYRGKLGYPQRELATWNHDQMQSYIQKYSQTHNWPDTASENLWRFLQETTNSQVQDLVIIPVYLTSLCIYYQQQSFPCDGSFLEGLDLKSAIQY